MDRPSTHRLSVEDAKEKLRRRSHPAAGAKTGVAGSPPVETAGSAPMETTRRPWRSVSFALAETRRRPWRSAGIALALGVAVGTSRTARRILLARVRKTLARGG